MIMFDPLTIIMQAIKLNFPPYDFTVRDQGGRREIFDPVRKKYVALTPEEWVRQHTVQFLLSEKHFPAGLTVVEGTITLNKTKKRYDLAVFGKDAKPLLIAECKAPEVTISQQVLDQIIRYNLILEAPYLLITNGLVHLFLKKHAGTYAQIVQLPDYHEIQC